MTKLQQILLSILLLLIFFLIVQISTVMVIPERNIECENQLYECQKYNVFQKALLDIGGQKYDENSYDCYNFSQDLQEELRKYNIESSIAINEGRDHAWLLVYVEAINGNFVGIYNDYNILEVRDNELNVICK